MADNKHSAIIIRSLPNADERTGEYVDHSVEAGDGIMYDIDPSVWGSHFWASIHLTAYAYPDEPSDETKQAVFNQFDSYRFALPCGACREHYRDNLKQFPIEDYLHSRDSLIQWTILVHSKVNESLEQPAFEFHTYLNRLTGEEAVVFATEDDQIETVSEQEDEEEKEEKTDSQHDDEDESGNENLRTNNFLSARSPSIHTAVPLHRRGRSTDPVRQRQSARQSPHLPLAQQDKHSSLHHTSATIHASSYPSNNASGNRTAVRHAHRIQQQMQRNNVEQQQRTDRAMLSHPRAKSPPPPGSRLAALMRARNRNRDSGASKSLAPSSFSRPSASSIKNASSRRQADSLRNARFKRPTNECENCTKSVMTPSSF